MAVRPVISQVSLEPFEGRDTDDWLGWKERFESLLEDEGTPPERRRNRFHLYLRGGALNYWRSLTPWERTEGPWETILDRFDARYASPDNADYHEREFYARHYKGENTEAAHDYLQDLVRRAELAFPDQVNQMGEVYERARERDSQVKRQFIAGMPPKLRNALFMKNQPHTTAEELAKWVRKKFAANKLSGVEEQLHESFNQAQVQPGRYSQQHEDKKGGENQGQAKPSGGKPPWKKNREFTPSAGYAGPAPSWATVAAAPPPNWGPYAYGLPQAPMQPMAPASFYPQGPNHHQQGNGAPNNQRGQHQGGGKWNQGQRQRGEGQGNRNGGQERNQGNAGGQGGPGGPRAAGRRRGDFSRTVCFGCGKTGHGVTQCPTFVLPFRQEAEAAFQAARNGAGGEQAAQAAPKAKQSKMPVDRVPAQQTINQAQASVEEAAAQYYNWYSENAQVLEQMAAAHAAYNMAGAEFVPGVQAGNDVDTDSSGNE